MKVRITVLKKEFYRELAEEYLTEGAAAGACPQLELGDEFTYEGGAVMPQGFCPVAWQDIYPALCGLMSGTGLINTWYKRAQTKILCCTDGVRPVVFKLEQISE